MANLDHDQKINPLPSVAPLNFVNLEAIEHFVDSFAMRAQRPEAKQWFRSNLRNFLLRASQFAREVGSDDIAILLGVGGMGELPTWVGDAVAAGKTLHWFEPGDAHSWEDGADLVRVMHHVVDWFDALAEDDRRWRQPHRIAVDDAVTAALAWHRQLARRVADEWPEDWSGLTSFMSFDDGSNAVRLSSPAALIREGQMMGHCVGTYANKVASGRCEIYSLRDKCNRPHATLEVIQGRVVQVRGKTNSALSPRWRPSVARLVRTMRWTASAWAGLLTYQGRVYVDAADILADIEELAPTNQATFEHARVLQILRFVQSIDPNGISKKEQSALLGALSSAAVACGGYKATRMAQPAIELPEASIIEFEVEIAGAAFTLAELGVFSDVIPDVVVLCRGIGLTVLNLIAANPDALFRLKLGPRCATRNVVGRFFASAGLAEEFRGVRSVAIQCKRERIAKGVVALRHRLADRRTIGAIPEATREKTMNVIRVLAPHFCQSVLCDPNVA